MEREFLYINISVKTIKYSHTQTNVMHRMQSNVHTEYVYMFCTIRVFMPYAYGTYHTRMVCTIRVWYNFVYHTRTV